MSEPSDEELRRQAEVLLALIDAILVNFPESPETGDRQQQFNLHHPDTTRQIILFRAGLAGMLMTLGEYFAAKDREDGTRIFELLSDQDRERENTLPYAQVRYLEKRDEGYWEGFILEYSNHGTETLIQRFAWTVFPDEQDSAADQSEEEQRDRFDAMISARRFEREAGLSIPSKEDFQKLIDLLGHIRRLFP